MTVNSLNTPILFLVFKRLETTKRVFSAIRACRPKRLYVASDGPRENILKEQEDVYAVRDYIIHHVDWDCEVKTLFRAQNLGCRRSVSGAIGWFFQHEVEGIILEDDCLPDPSFFRFTEDLLTRYRDDNRVMAIAGNYFAGDAYKTPYSYYFSRYNHCWGWATWRRAWAHYDAEMKQWPTLRNTDWLMTVGDGSTLFQRYWHQIFEATFLQDTDSWAYVWTFSCWAQNGLSILPSHNLVSNIGFGEGAAHTGYAISERANLPTREMTVPLVHPVSIVNNYTADKWTFENLYILKLRQKFLLKLQRLKRNLKKHS